MVMEFDQETFNRAPLLGKKCETREIKSQQLGWVYLLCPKNNTKVLQSLQSEHTGTLTGTLTTGTGWSHTGAASWPGFYGRSDNWMRRRWALLLLRPATPSITHNARERKGKRAQRLNQTAKQAMTNLPWKFAYIIVTWSLLSKDFYSTCSSLTCCHYRRVM